MKFSFICCGLFKKKSEHSESKGESRIAMAIQRRDKYQLILTQEYSTSFGRSFAQEPLSALSPTEQEMPEQEVPKLPAEFERRVR